MKVEPRTPQAPVPTHTRRSPGAHPLFPRKESKPEGRDIRFVTFQRRRPDGKIDNCPEDIPADEVGSWADIVGPFGGGEYKAIGKDKNRKVVARSPAEPDEWLLFDQPPKPFLVRAARRNARELMHPAASPEPVAASAPAPPRTAELATEALRELRASRATQVSQTDSLLMMMKQNAETTRALLTAALVQRTATPPAPDPTELALALLREIMGWRAAAAPRPPSQPQTSFAEQLGTLQVLLDLVRPSPAPPAQSIIGEFKDLVTTISKEDAAARAARTNPSGAPESEPPPRKSPRLVVVPGVGLVNVLEPEPNWSPSAAAGAPVAPTPAPTPVGPGSLVSVPVASPAVAARVAVAPVPAPAPVGRACTRASVVMRVGAPQPTVQSVAMALPAQELSPAPSATPVRAENIFDTATRNPAVEALLRALHGTALSNAIAATSASSPVPTAPAATTVASEASLVHRPSSATTRPAEPLGAALLAAILACAVSRSTEGEAVGPGNGAMGDAHGLASDVLPGATPTLQAMPPAAQGTDVAGADVRAGARAEPPAHVLDIAGPGPSDVSTEVTSDAPASPAVIELPERMPVPVPLPPRWASNDDISDKPGAEPEEVMVPPDRSESGDALLRVLREDESGDPAAALAGSRSPTEPPPMVAVDVACPRGREVSPEATSDTPSLPKVIEPPEHMPIPIPVPPPWGVEDDSGGPEQVARPPDQAERGDALAPVAREDEPADQAPAVMDGDAKSDAGAAPPPAPALDAANCACTDLPPAPALDRGNSGDDAAPVEPAAIALPAHMPVPVPLPPLWASDDELGEGTGARDAAPSAWQPGIEGARAPEEVLAFDDLITPQPSTDAELFFACEARS